MAPPQTILFTRKRWDRIFAIATVLAVIVAGIWIYVTGHLRFCVVPVAFVGMWVYFRRTTPISGEQMETIEGNPWTIRLLVFLGSIVVLVLCFYAFDRFVLEHPVNGSPRWYHWLFFVVTISAMTTGAHLIGRAAKRQRENRKSGKTSDRAAAQVGDKFD